MEYSTHPNRDYGKLRKEDLFIFYENTSTVRVFSPHIDHRTQPEAYSRPGARVDHSIFMLLRDRLIAPPIECRMEIIFAEDLILMRCLKPPVDTALGCHKLTISTEEVNDFYDRNAEKGSELVAAGFEGIHLLFDHEESFDRFSPPPNGVKVVSWMLGNMFGTTVRHDLTKNSVSWSFTLLRT